MRWRAIVAIGVVLAAAVAATGVGNHANAAASSALRVDRGHGVARWAGGPFQVVPGLPAVSNPRPEVCAINCEKRALRIDFPSSTWKHPGDGVLVAIHWATSDNGLNLYVYGPSGALVGSADGLDANGEAVLIPHPVAGVYSVVVTVTYMTAGTASYDGEARLRPDPARACAKPPCAMLPHLRTVAPADFHLDGIPPVPSTQLGFPIPFGPGTPNSCYPDETGVGMHRCLRFTNEIRNDGAGPLRMRFTFLGAGTSGPRVGFVDCRMEQIVNRTDGTTLSRSAGPCTFHLGHAHFHYANFAEFGLHRVRPDGSTDSKELRKSIKRGFCLTDVRNFAFGSAQNSQRTYWFPNCNLPALTQLASTTDSAGNVWEEMGISTGWADVYTWDTPDQYIEISGVPDGVYDVVSTANPDGGISEGPRRDNSARTRICLQGNAVKVMASGAKPAKGCRAS